MILEYGILEVYTKFEGHEFIIEKLHPGSIINLRMSLMEELMHVSIRSKEKCSIIEITKSHLEHIFQEEEKI